jgi:hypothetical protein
MIEPEIYVMYIIALHHNISPQRAIKLWADTKSAYYERETGRGQMKEIISSHLKEFWKRSNNEFKLSKSQDVIDMMKKLQPKWWKFW